MLSKMRHVNIHLANQTAKKKEAKLDTKFKSQREGGHLRWFKKKNKVTIQGRKSLAKFWFCLD